MTISQSTLKELNGVIKEYTSDRIAILASPGEIRNSGKWVLAMQVIVYDNQTKKTHHRMYRGEFSGFRVWMKEIMDKIINK